MKTSKKAVFGPFLDECTPFSAEIVGAKVEGLKSTKIERSRISIQVLYADHSGETSFSIAATNLEKMESEKQCFEEEVTVLEISYSSMAA